MNRVKYLLTYRYSEIIFDLTIEFTQRFVLGHLSNLSNLGGSRKPDFRTADQMNQAARSTKQNIVEGVGQAPTSKKGEIKLLGVAKASVEELLEDYQDFLRLNSLPLYPKADSRVQAFRKKAYFLSNLSNLSNLGELIEKPELPPSPEEAANFLLTLCHMLSFLLDKQIKAMEDKFTKEGGLTEELYRKRKEYRGY